MPTSVLFVAIIWPFASGWMLLWALAAAIPIIIHLWNRRRYQEVTWAAMEYLLAAMRKNSRRITIEQLILLAIRVMILLTLAVALADPFWPSLSSFVPGMGMGGQTHWVLVIDGSYSMDYRENEKTRFDAAKELATQLVDDSTQGDGFTLVLMSDPPQVIVRQPAFARDDVNEEIQNLRLRHTGGNLSTTLAEVEKIVGAAAEKHPRLSQTKVCFFTDLGQTTWEEVDLPVNRKRIGALGQRATLAMINLGGAGQQDNLAVTQLTIDESLVTIGRDVSVQAEVQNLGAASIAGHLVEFLVDGKRVNEQRLDVDAGGRASASMTYRFSVPGEHHVEVRLDDERDLLSVDNHRWISVPVRESIPVLCVQGKPGSAHHVALALQPSKSNRPRIVPKVAAENALLEMELAEFDCVMICNVGRFGRDESAVLTDYLKSGGGLVFFLGDQVQPDSYNEALGGKEGQRILPAKLMSLASESQYQFDPLEYRHPIVAAFRGHQQSGLLSTPVWKYFKLEQYDKTTSKVALAFQGGDPAIIEEPMLRGRSILYASAASGQSLDQLADPPVPWTAIHTWLSFPPLVQEMLALAVRGRTEGRNLRVGESLEGEIQQTIVDTSLTMVKPDGDDERVKLSVDGEDSRWSYGETWQSGIYEATFGEPLKKSERYAVNINTRESNLERFDAELLPSQFRQDYKVENLDAPDLPTSSKSQLFQYMLVCLLLLLFTESFVAWYFGRVRAI